MRNRSILLAGLALLLIIVAPLVEAAGESGPNGQKSLVQTTPEKSKPEVIQPAPKNIKEKTAICVFLAWLWLLIGVLIYFLRLKIKEADRIFNLKFYSF